jgi:hypothetical protein
LTYIGTVDIVSGKEVAMADYEATATEEAELDREPDYGPDGMDLAKEAAEEARLASSHCPTCGERGCDGDYCAPQVVAQLVCNKVSKAACDYLRANGLPGLANDLQSHLALSLGRLS